MDELRKRIEKLNYTCVDQDREIYHKDELSKFKEVAKEFFTGDRAKVVICFCEGEAVGQLLNAMKQLNLTGKGFLIVGTDGWADRLDILGDLVNQTTGMRELSEAAVGSISIRLHSEKLKDFDNYFQSKTFRSSDGNPWFQEFWEQTFNCTINKLEYSKYNRTCFGNESLHNKDYTQDSKLGFVVKSIMTVAFGLHNLLKCNSTTKQCDRHLRINGTLLLDEMLNVSFRAYDNEIVQFDSNGDPPGWYDIMNYKSSNDRDGNKNFKYEKIGTWKKNQLTIDAKLIQLPESSDGKPFISVCSPACTGSQIKVFTKKQCCWTCSNCTENQKIVVTDGKENCVTCDNGTVPTSNRSTCENISATYIQWNNTSSIIAVTFASFGILTTVVITGIFARFNNTPVVKSSTRELMYVILVGIALSYSTTFALIMKPSPVSCTMTRIMPGLSLSLMYGSLVTKTNRICRILAISKKKIIRSRGRFLTTRSQLFITFTLNTMAVAIIFTLTWFIPPRPIRVSRNWNEAFLICDTPNFPLFIPLGFDTLLVCFCTWYAFKTRKLPENFNEAKFIGFTMYTTCIIWLGFVVTYFGSNLKVISLCFSISLSATVVILLLFMPKVYIILFRPQKNERAAFTTTTEIRCHIGSGKTDNQCSKDKLQPPKSNSKHLLKCPAALRNCSSRKSSLGYYIDDCTSFKVNCCQSQRDQEISYPYSDRETKITQTEFPTVFEFLYNLSDSLAITNGELTFTQISLLKFLEENWNSETITRFDKGVDQFRTDHLCVEETFLDDDDDQLSEIPIDDTDLDNNSPQHPILRQSNSAVTCSPISNVSTDASSTINTMFLDYLHMHGKQFKNLSDKKSVKL